jgi:uncharacterized protein YyaL (SSP411 family)
MTNRLAASTSPYLLQHRDNPVDWWEWSEQAFAEARRRDVPVLLSVGYSACHWCHVMAHESFEDEGTAKLMNNGFVNIKVDREERPDIDSVYMEATQAMTGHGGWPMTCFLTPDGAPFFCGTYYPREHFQRLLRAVGSAWCERRGEIEQVGGSVVAQLRDRGNPPAGDVTPELLEESVRTLAREYDARHAGFGGAPKFPPSMVLEFLLRHGSAEALRMAEETCERMARGGLYDQLGGGFARYSVDAQWVVPHFEKMLYDNALLLRVYAHLWRRTRSALAERVVRETAEFLLRDLATADGGFASALDADSEGEEGKFYVWTYDEVGPRAAEVFGVTREGTFEHGRSVLQLPGDPDPEERARLFALRAQRVPPGRDDKVVAAWNGLAIAALADAGALFAQPGWVTAAVRCAELLEEVHVVDGRLRRTSRDGRAGTNAAVLEDYADAAEGYLALAQATSDGRWLVRAETLLDVVLAHFGDGRGAFFDTSDDAERLVRRPQDLTDNATPAGTSAAAGALLTLSALTGSTRHRDAALGALVAVAPLLPRFARFAGWATAVGEAALAGPAEVAIVGPDAEPLIRAARMSGSPGAVVAAGPPEWAPLLRDRAPVDGRATAYVCRNFACQLPVTTAEALEEQLHA